MSVVTLILEPIDKKEETMETLINPPVQHIIDRAILEGNTETIQKEADYLKQRLESYRLENNEMNTKIESIRNHVKDFLVEQISNDNISAEDAKDLADKIGIEITKTITVSGTISFGGKVEVSIFEDINDYDIRYNVDVDHLDMSAYGESLYSFDYDIEEVNFEDS